ncbi:hypothetical protein JTB14_022949 [Gonioctena quinquepunctata]|nr:hypothetical protein JTB14_022949 [Gonioctena quinquepunctata]
MVSCISCKISHVARGKTNISFHRIPSNSSLREAWLAFLKLKDNDIPKRSHLCSQHFEEEAFDRSSHLKVRLKIDAVPSILIFRTRTYDKTNTGRKAIIKKECMPESYTKTKNNNEEYILSIKIEDEIEITETSIEETMDEVYLEEQDV